jgi:hypothetical protein
MNEILAAFSLWALKFLLQVVYSRLPLIQLGSNMNLTHSGFFINTDWMVSAFRLVHVYLLSI